MGRFVKVPGLTPSQLPQIYPRLQRLLIAIFPQVMVLLIYKYTITLFLELINMFKIIDFQKWIGILMLLQTQQLI